MWRRSSDFKDLSYLIGKELVYEGGLQLLCPPDGSVKIIEEYKNTVILEMEWILPYLYIQIILKSFVCLYYLELICMTRQIHWA